MVSFRVSLLSLVLFSGLGCATATTSNTARTSTEQLLITNAVDQSLDKIDFRPFRGHAVFLNDKYADCVDKNYVIASVRHRILQSGARLVDSADKSEITVELRTGAVGTASSNSFIGVPEIVLPGVVTLPEVRFAERKKQSGTAKIGLVAFETGSGMALGTGGQALAQSEDSNWFVVGAGPFRSGNVKGEISSSTTGQAAVRYTQIPKIITFAAPDPSGTQLAAEPLQTIDPVSLEKNE
ncbi:DUF6655 family protein [Thalassoglobus sp. JC818]|uniref:DUF6655 family protein n=1 Tax=Thalassoglobus sp. JC818 TaxID=3232136 RepID=UPI00345B0035